MMHINFLPRIVHMPVSDRNPALGTVAQAVMHCCRQPAAVFFTMTSSSHPFEGTPRGCLPEMQQFTMHELKTNIYIF